MELGIQENICNAGNEWSFLDMINLHAKGNSHYLILCTVFSNVNKHMAVTYNYGVVGDD